MKVPREILDHPKAHEITVELTKRLYGDDYETDDDGAPVIDLVADAARNNHTVTITYEELNKIGGFVQFPKHLYTAIEWWAGDYRMIVGFGLNAVLLAADAAPL